MRPNSAKFAANSSADYFIILFYKFAIAIDLYRVLWLQMTGISTQR